MRRPNDVAQSQRLKAEFQTLKVCGSTRRVGDDKQQLVELVQGVYFCPMPDDSFKEFVLDQLSALPDVHAKAMFGAHGIYSDDHFFGILDEGRLFFKTDAASQADYTARGMGPFTYTSRGKVMTMSYHEVPPDVLEQPLELVEWARKAISIAAQKPGKTPKRKRQTEPVAGEIHEKIRSRRLAGYWEANHGIGAPISESARIGKTAATSQFRNRRSGSWKAGN